MGSVLQVFSLDVPLFTKSARQFGTCTKLQFDLQTAAKCIMIGVTIPKMEEFSTPGVLKTAE
jgi:hypothetical protein